MALQGLSFDFEVGTEGFTHDRMPEVAGSGVSWTFDHWQHGSPTGQTCASGQKCWATNLMGNYVQCGRGYLMSPPLDLSECAAEGQDVRLAFEHLYDFWTGEWNSSTWYDGGLVEVSSDGQNWTAIDPGYSGTIAINPNMTASYACVDGGNFHVHDKSGFVGSSGGWQSAVALIDSSLLSSSVQIRFSYSSGVSSQTTSQSGSQAATRPGWYIDALRLEMP
jgi:hypothetical protein